MINIIAFTALLASTIAAPGLLLDTHVVHAPIKSTLSKSSHLVDHGSTTVVHAPVIPVHTLHAVSVPVSSKTTVTKNAQLVNHGSHEIHTIPYVHQPVHTIIHEPVHIAHVATHVPVKTKTVVTKNSQLVNHGGHKIVHVPVHHEVMEHLVASVPVAYHSATSSQFFKLDNTHAEVPHVKFAKVSRSGDSAVSHHSSTVHETVAHVKSLPLYTLHH